MTSVEREIRISLYFSLILIHVVHEGMINAKNTHFMLRKCSHSITCRDVVRNLHLHSCEITS